MNHFSKIHSIVIVLIGSALCLTSCKKPTLPVVSTAGVSGITQTIATAGGNVTDDGGEEVTTRGTCWGTSQNPTTNSGKTSDGKGTGNFTSNITGLTPGTNYYVRAYAINSVGTAYGNEVSFSTNPVILATLTTAAVTSVTASTAISGGNITIDGGGEITARGICWGTTPNPTVSQNKTTDGSGTGTFVSNLTGLLPATTYYVRSYATNIAGTAYGDEINFKTNPDLPVLTTTSVSSITAFSAQSGGNITSDNGATVTARGVCWNTNPNPTTNDPKTSNGTGTGTFGSDLNNLQPNTSYYVRAYATNSVGTSYGNQQNFATKDGTTIISTNGVTEIKTNSALCGGNITDDGGSPITVRGVCWNVNPEPTIANNKTTDGSGTGIFSSNITGLQPNTTYYVKAYATNSIKTSYGIQQIFKTKDGTAILTTAEVTNIMVRSARGGGSINDDGGSSISERGICWSTSHNPTTSSNNSSNGSGTGVYTGNLTLLQPNTIYYIRAYAINYFGTWYGNEVNFKTFAVEDIDGIVYNSVTIGTQVWLKENLRTSKFNDGEAIPLVTDKAEWAALTTPGYCWFDNDAVTYKNAYGGLYNWYAVNKGNLCPTGWHVPTNLEWTTLADFLGGPYVAGGKLKETGTEHWSSPNIGATNETQFTALGGGGRSYDGIYNNFGIYGCWWSSSVSSPATLSFYRYIIFNDIYLAINHFLQATGFSVRCVKD
jgi:uncharacterized protein (TIGR02145 family)